jgi:ketosteroid isomerase-like protein
VRHPSDFTAVSRPEYYGNPAGVTHDVEVVRALYEAFGARDLEAALPLVAPDAELYAEGTAELAGRTGPYRGHDGLRTYFADVERVWDQLELFADDFRVVPGFVVVMGHVAVARGGHAMQRGIVWTWRLRNGLATYMRVADMGELPAA